MTILSPSPKLQFFTVNGDPLAGGKLYTYAAGTTTPLATYTDSTGITPNTNPVILDARGEASIWLFSTLGYKFVLKTATEVLIYTVDNINGTTTPDQFAMASTVGYTPAGTGAVVTNVQTKLRETVSVKDFGAVGDGVTNDTVAIQNAITFARLQGGQSRKLYWPRGTYLITNTITIGTNQYVDFDPGVTINFVPADPLNTYCFVAANQSAIYFNGNGTTINGTRGTVAGQGVGTGFFIYGCDNVVIRDFTINNFATDGITLTGDNTGSGPCTDVLIENCRVNNCRRNGMSIISALDCTVIGGSYNGTNGALGGPWAGIDIEPNQDCFLENVNLIGVSTANNDGAGIQFTPGGLSFNVARRFSVFVTSGRSVSDGDLTGVSGLYFANGGSFPNKVFGEIVVDGFIVDSPKSRGVNFREWEHDKCPRAVLNNVSVYNPDSTLNTASNADRSGFVIGLDATQNSTTLGNIVMNNCHAEDTRSPPRMVWGMVAFSDAAKEIKDVTVIDPRSVNFTAGNKADIITTVANGPGTSNFFDVVYSRPIPVDLSASQSIADFGGKRINVTVSSNVFTLPSASNCGGLSYEIQNAVGVSSTTVAVQPGETILGIVGVAGTSLVLDAGGFVRLRSITSGSWHVEALDGLWRLPGMVSPRQIQFNSAAPVSGTWTRGDIVFNSNAAIGQPKGWQCTVSGTPGTWVSMGNL